MSPVGFARNLSSSASSQVMSAFFIPAEKLNPGTVPLLLPTMPASDGPILFWPASVAWHAAQCVAKTRWPATGSPAASALEELPRTVTSTRIALVGESFMSCISPTPSPCTPKPSAHPRGLGRHKLGGVRFELVGSDPLQSE